MPVCFVKGRVAFDGAHTNWFSHGKVLLGPGTRQNLRLRHSRRFEPGPGRFDGYGQATCGASLIRPFHGAELRQSPEPFLSAPWTLC